MSPTFTYTAVATDGSPRKGEIDTKDAEVARTLLQAQGLNSVRVAKPKGDGKFLGLEISGSGNKAVNPKDLAIMSRQMATMISAGLPVLRTLRILAQQTENKKLAKVLESVSSDVESGISLSSSMAKHPVDIPPIMIGLVAAGEQGGFLDQALENVATTLERDTELKATVKSAMTYPIAVLFLAVIAVIAMLIWVVPVFEKMFADLGGELPLPTRILVFLSPIATWGAPFFALLGFLGFRWWGKNKNKDFVRKMVDPLKLKLPVIGQITTKLAIARFTRNLSSLVNAGVPMLQAFNLVSETASSYPYQQALLRIQESVRLGTTVAVPMSSEPLFPPMVTRMIAVGEESGALGQMLSKIADFYDAEVKADTNQLTSLIEPLMVALVGIVVGAMVISLYLPIFTIFTQISGSG